MSSQLTHQEASNAAPASGSVNILRAWLSVTLIPAVLVGAMFVGEALISALGYPTGVQPVPLPVALIVAIPVNLVAMVPAALAVLFGRRARREGHASAVVAIVIGWAALVFWVGTFALALIDRVLR
jgi:ABC-type uncharacterized transport system permease subunit